MGARSTWSSTAQNDHHMTSKYRESDKKAVGSYAFQSLSRYFDVIRDTMIQKRNFC